MSKTVLMVKLIKIDGTNKKSTKKKNWKSIRLYENHFFMVLSYWASLKQGFFFKKKKKTNFYYFYDSFILYVVDKISYFVT